MKKYICLLLLFGAYFTVQAQTELEQINAIKSNLDFLSATGTSTKSSEDAVSIAKDLIALEIEQWLKDNSVDNIAGYVAKSCENISQITTQRGSLFRVFVYVKKTDILTYNKGDDVLVVDLAENKLTSKNEVASTSANLSSAPKDKINESLSPVVESKPVYVPSAFERQLISIKTFSSLNDYINQGRERGDILNVGNYKTLPTSGNFYVFIHNREGNVPACLKPNGTTYINIVTGEEDAITNYKGCGAIWIQF